jgi:O-antigen/teichoic acid export membrane protein
MISDTARENGAKAGAHFRKFRLVFLLASVTMAVGFITLSRPVVGLVLRPQYAATAWMLQLLGFRAALELFGSAASAMLLAVGITRYAAIGNTARVIYLAVGLGIAFSWFGLREGIWVLAFSPLIQYLVMLVGLQKQVRFVLRTELACFGTFLLVVALTVFLCRSIALFT